MSQQEKEESSYKWQMELLSAVDYAQNSEKGRGTIPGFVREWYDSLKQPRVRWTDKVRNTATKVFRGRYTFKRPSRRGPAMGLRLPGWDPDRKGVMIWIDSSGSMSVDELTRAYSEVVGMMKQLSIPKIWVLFHHVNVYHCEEFSENSLAHFKGVESGGTSHRECFDVLEGNHPEYKINGEVGMVVAFTDLYSDFPDSCDTPIIWATSSSKNPDPPFGTKLVVEN